MPTNDPLAVDLSDADERVRHQQAENAYRLVEGLRNRRKALGLRQKDVARRMGRDAAVVSNLERLGSDPRWSSLQRYASALGVVIAYDLMPADEEFRGSRRVAADDLPDVDTATAVRGMLAAR